MSVSHPARGVCEPCVKWWEFECPNHSPPCHRCVCWLWQAKQGRRGTGTIRCNMDHTPLGSRKPPCALRGIERAFTSRPPMCVWKCSAFAFGWYFVFRIVAQPYWPRKVKNIHMCTCRMPHIPCGYFFICTFWCIKHFEYPLCVCILWLLFAHPFFVHCLCMHICAFTTHMHASPGRSATLDLAKGKTEK